MCASSYRLRAIECGRLSQDASRTAAERVESKFQQSLWLKLATESDENDDDARR
jgi:hypothetical protein